MDPHRSALERLARRHVKERRFRATAASATVFALAVVGLLFFSIATKGYHAFSRTEILLEVELDPTILGVDPGTIDEDALSAANYRRAIQTSLRAHFPRAMTRQETRRLYRLIGGDAALELRDRVLADPALVGRTLDLWLVADDDIDSLRKGLIPREGPESDRRVKDDQIAWYDTLSQQGQMRSAFNATFFTAGDSREPEQAGILGALMGSVFTLSLTLLLAFPLGVATAVYLEEFAPRNRWTDILEININNLAAVPSVVFGLLGLAVFINFGGLPRSTPLVGGLVLALMILPTIIIASRSALAAVPRSIREAALGIGASQVQVVTDHLLPLALPGMLTGTILGMARALGETAPLLMIGMVAFIVDVPRSPLDPATALPVQIYLWADSPERAFVAHTSGAIIVTLAILIAMNGVAVAIRARFQRHG